MVSDYGATSLVLEKAEFKGMFLWLSAYHCMLFQCSPHTWLTTHILLRKSCWYSEVTTHLSICTKCLAISLINSSCYLFFSILCRVKIEARMNKEDIWWIMLFSWTSFFLYNIQQNLPRFVFWIALQCNCYRCLFLYLESDKQVCLHFENSTVKSHNHSNLQIRF